MSLWKLNKHHEISFRQMKSYSDEIFLDKLRSIDFPDYLNHTCVNHSYQNFVSKFLQNFDSVSSITTIRALNPIQDHHKYYEKLKQSGKETDKDNLKYARFLLLKIMNNKKKLYLLKEKNDENTSNLKEIW